MIDSEQLPKIPPKIAIQPSEGESITSLMTNNTYTIGKKIGEGNFGIVYSCHDVWGNELTAKVLKPIGTYEKVKKNAEGEFARLKQLRHPFITFVYDAFEFRNTFYIIAEKCFSPISAIFALENLNGMSWLIPMARQLLQAVNYLHLNNYVHQDIHDGNVFATFIKDEMVPNKEKIIQFKLGDLGVTKLLHEIDLSNTGAPWMLPPEILNPGEFGPTDTRIDIYHVGILLLQLAYSKRLQFSNQETLEGKPREMALNLNVPYNFALEKALRRHVKYRTATAMEFWRDLNALDKSTLPTLQHF